MDARDILNEITSAERDFREREFLAPYTEMSRKAIVKVDGIHYPFKIGGFPRTPGSGGIGMFKPQNPTFAKFVREADADVAREYLDMLPFVYMVLAYETDLGWVAYPMNLQSAQRKIGLDCEIIVRNISDVERFDTVTVRYDGMHFWFDGIFPGADMIKAAAMREVFKPDKPNQMQGAMLKIAGITPEELKAVDLAVVAWTAFKKMSTEDLIRDALAPGGGKLTSYVVRGQNVEINWQSRSGEKYNSVLDRETLDAVTPGICVAVVGEDPHGDTTRHKHKFHVSDLPFVVAEAEEQHRVVRFRQHQRIDMENIDEEDWDED